MAKVNYAQLLLKIGSVAFFECKSQSYLFGKSTYYWKFIDSADHYGPFKSLLEAGEHFDYMMRSSSLGTSHGKAPQGSVTSAISTNLIKIDFKTKKRLT